MISWRSKPQAADEEKPKGFDDFDLRLGDIMRGERATLGKSLLDVQRELKIKATYIAAIENADISAFESPGFVAGYVRSYSRYLGMDSDLAFARFCKEANFTPAHGMSAQAGTPRAAQARPRSDFSEPLANPNLTFVPRGESWLSKVEPGAVGSLAVLVALIGAIGYGGWSILQEVQRVQLAPVDEAPSVVVSIDPLQQDVSQQSAMIDEASRTPVTQTAQAGAEPDLMDRLYRPQALDVPVFESRNGPIGSIDPRAGGAASGSVNGTVSGVIAAAPGEAAQGGVIQVTADAPPGVQILAVRPAWMRVSSADGTVLFEKILNTCESYQLPALEDVASLRTGNSGGVYFVVGGKTYGPAAPGANVASNIALSPEAVTAKYAEADLAKDRDLARIMTADASGGVPNLAASCATTTPAQ
ncbi:helix-turn-helix domain-containing protein [Pseudogemmobacter bohemicus]|uniref:helix-turn-helix domain-containing protein n=1 Tax=Pseudogemmobacter bohemicus TaxID=2250708 RepID=UPI000DD34A35|nr:helix-turn-helix domain-containing protein [Pseudogemmobacter bohemicus]